MSPIEVPSLTRAPRHYLCPKVDRPIAITGRMDDPLWAMAEWSDDFIDILGEDGPTPRYRTRVKMLWDDEYLTIGAELEEPHVWATLTEHDSVIFHDNDFEVFIDPDGDCHLYGELEINALNTTWDLLLTKPYRVGGAAVNGWEIHGLRTAVHVDGTLNDASDEDRGWSVEIAIPWKALEDIARRAMPPASGDVMRINFSRVQWQHDVVDGQYRKRPGLSEDNWVWSPQGVIDMHRPHRWGLLQFSDGDWTPPARVAADAAALMELYDAQHHFRSRTGHWARDLQELDVTSIEDLTIETTSTLLEMTLGEWSVDQDSRLWKH